MYDGVSWSSIVLIFVVGSFLYNLLKYRHSNPPPSPSQAVPLVNSKSGHFQLHSPPLSPLSPIHQQQQVHSQHPQHRRPKIVSVGSGRYALGQENQHLVESDIDCDKKERDMYAKEEGMNTDRKYERFANISVPRSEGRDNEIDPFQWAVTPKMGNKGRI